MIRFINGLALVAVLTTCAAAPAAVEVGVGASSEFTTNYLWRGYYLGPAGLFNDANVGAQLSPEWSVGADVWNYTRVDGTFQTNEFDYTLSVSYAPASLPVSFTAGWTYYDILNNGDTQEAFFGADFDFAGSPSIYLYKDYDLAPGTYVLLGAGHSLSLDEQTSVDFSAGLGLDFGRGIDVFNDFSVGTTLNYQINDYLGFYGNLGLVVPSHQVATYGARGVAGFGFAASKTF